MSMLSRAQYENKLSEIERDIRELNEDIKAIETACRKASTSKEEIEKMKDVLMSKTEAGYEIGASFTMFRSITEKMRQSISGSYFEDMMENLYGAEEEIRSKKKKIVDRIFEQERARQLLNEQMDAIVEETDV